MKKSYLMMFGISIIIVLLIIINQVKENNKISNKIIDYIDEHCDKDNSCLFTMDDIIDFKWDKLLMYKIGSSNNEISKLLGVEFNKSVDVSVGIVFVYRGRIVYQERKTSNVELPEDLTFYIGNVNELPQYMVNTPSEAYYKGVRECYNGKYYYSIIQIDSDEINKQSGSNHIEKNINTKLIDSMR